jgi:hypothetical protein
MMTHRNDAAAFWAASFSQSGVRLLCLTLAAALAGCGTFGGGGRGDAGPPAQQIDLAGTQVPATTAPRTPERAGATGLGVNGYLWRAALDTLRFMPLASADPFGGTIITDWFAPPETPAERFKATVYILDKRLRADALRVSVFHQTRDKNGEWADAAVDPATNGKMENAVLARARQLRLASTEK